MNQVACYYLGRRAATGQGKAREEGAVRQVNATADAGELGIGVGPGNDGKRRTIQALYGDGFIDDDAVGGVGPVKQSATVVVQPVANDDGIARDGSINGILDIGGGGAPRQ